MRQVIFHIDVNSAFLSWSAVKELEQGSKRDLRLIPSVVGGDEKSRHGIVLAKSLPAKKYNITTGESLHSARLKCPDLVSVRGDYDYFALKSKQLLDIANNYSDRVAKYSIDECFLDFTGMERLLGDPVRVAHEIKDRIKNELGFTVNIGVGSNKLLAKMAGDLEKPDKVHVVFSENIKEKLWHLPVGDLFMAGRQSVKKLKTLGIFTIGDLANSDILLLRKHFKSYGSLLWQYANGIDNSGVCHWAEEKTPPKSISMSRTLPKDISTSAEAHKIILCLTESVCRRLRELNFICGVVSVFIKNTDFFVYGIQKKLFQRSDCTELIYDTAAEIFDSLWKGDNIRLLGVRVSDFVSGEVVQLNLLETNIDKYRRLNEAVDEVRSRYGYSAVFRGILFEERRKTRLASSFALPGGFRK